MKFHVDGALPTDQQIFVFGSNLAGYHAGGAAYVAKEQFGAVDGEASGEWGESYAIPTLDEQFQKRALEDIALDVVDFLIHAEDSDDEFFVTRIGCGIAGFTDSEIAPMFKGAPDNCSFAEEWKPYV
jgi:hypothetical protein